jgi:hypothetical protein
VFEDRTFAVIAELALDRNVVQARSYDFNDRRCVGVGEECLKILPSSSLIACSRCSAWMHQCRDHMDVKERPYMQILLRGALRRPWPLNENI